MTELRQQLVDIIMDHSPIETRRSQVEQAKTLRDLPIDSLALLGAFYSIELRFDIELDPSTPDTTLIEFEAMVSRLITQKG